MRRRVRVEARVVEESSRRKEKENGGGGGKKKAKKGLLSFADEEGEGDVAVKPRKAKFNTALIASDGMDVEEKPTPKINGHGHSERPADAPPPAKRRKPSVSPPRREKLLASMTAHSSPLSKSPDAPPRRKPSFHDPTTQLPLRNEEIPSRSETSSPLPASNVAAGPSKSKSILESEIAALKASMRRDTAPAPAKKKLSAFEAMIPATSTRGRKRPRPGETGQREDKHALEMLNAFKARLDSVKDVDVDVDGDVDGNGDMQKGKGKNSSSTVAAESKRLNGLKIASPNAANTNENAENDNDEEETPLCDLHFIANCQSCSKWDSDLHLDDPSSSPSKNNNDNQDTDKDWMSHRLAFGRDQLGKDLNFKKRREALEELVVIDPREKAGQILAAEREKQRVRKEEMKKGRR
jgi:peptidyl-prolyl cis-trans isomerase SDCCAG10